MPTKTEAQLLNQTLFDQLADRGMEKHALDAINEFTRTRIREDGFARRLMPPLMIGNDDLDRQTHTDKNVKIVDKEPDIPPAISVPYGALPINWYIRGPRYAVTFDRIMTPRFSKDMSELRSWNMDIRQVISDNSIKDMLAEEDTKFISAVNTALIGANLPVPTSGVAQYVTVPGGVTRDTVMTAFQVMPKTPFHLMAETLLINNVTVHELQKWGRDEMGGDLSQEILRNGWTERRFFDKDLLITIKRDLVPDNTMFMFANPKFIGKTFMLDDATMWAKREFFFIEFFAYEELGASIGHTGGLARVDFT